MIKASSAHRGPVGEISSTASGNCSIVAAAAPLSSRWLEFANKQRSDSICAVNLRCRTWPEWRVNAVAKLRDSCLQLHHRSARGVAAPSKWRGNGVGRDRLASAGAADRPSAAGKSAEFAFEPSADISGGRFSPVRVIFHRYRRR